MSEQKKDKPLSNIPAHILRSMSKDVEKGMDQFSNPVDFIMNERKKHQIEVSGPSGMPLPTAAPTPTGAPVPGSAAPATAPEPSKIPLVAIDGHVLPGDTVTMMLYSLVTLAKKDKVVRKLLRSFKYTMRDVNGDVIFK